MFISLGQQKTTIILISIVLHLQIYKGQQQHSSHIMQQILDLKRLQLTDGSNLLPMIRGQEQTDISSSIHYSPEFDENLDQHSQLSQDSSLQELKVETLPFTFSQMENLPSSSNVGLPVPGESFWQCKSPVQSSQVWSWSSSSVLELNHCLMNHLLIGYTVNSFLLKGAKSIISFSWNQHIQ